LLFAAPLRPVPGKERTQDKPSREKFGAYDCFPKIEPYGLLDLARRLSFTLRSPVTEEVLKMPATVSAAIIHFNNPLGRGRRVTFLS
jgi:hypothetical protein